MEEIDAKFKGIELAVINPSSKDKTFFRRIKGGFVSLMLGNRVGFTIIGPATVVKEIKKNPDKIELFTKDIKNKKRK